MTARLLILPALLSLPAWAQPAVAPTTERVGEVRGTNYGNYNLTQSWETGVRFFKIGGNEGKYRSDVNFRNGLRLLGGRLSLNSRNGKGSFLDEFTFASQGLGNDPYQFASTRVRKNRLFSYDMLWRENAYFNPALPISGGLQSMDTHRRLQDHDITLFPQSKIRFFAGFSRASQWGPALSTTLQWDAFGANFPIFQDVRRRQNEFRFGNETQVGAYRLHWMFAEERFAEDSPRRITAPVAGLQPNQDSQLVEYRQSDPWEGRTPNWRVSLFREQRGFWAMNGRLTHSAGRRAFLVEELARGSARFGSRNRQVALAGAARRPVTTAQLTLSLFPTEDLTISSHTFLHQTRMEGDARLTELDNGDLSLESSNLQSLGIRSVTNTSDLNWRWGARTQVHGGYQFAARQVRSVEFVNVFGFANRLAASQTNRLHAGFAGFRVQALPSLTLAFDGELGRQDRPFYPTSDKDYHGLSARALWQGKSLTLSATTRIFYNFNSVSLAAHSARNRSHTADVSWSPAAWFSADAGYAKWHTGTASWLFYFAQFRPLRGERSLYISNLHTGHLNANFSIRGRVDFTIGYSRTQDTGDGRTELALPPAGADAGPALEPFRIAQTYPMTFESPLGRVSLRLGRKLRWNAGYQYYRYRESFLANQNYRAHTGFTSLLWAF
jgi:hypothetical protein